jgi:phosphoglycolate phosphatase
VLKDAVHILFDLDGTLTDPREGIVGCIRHALERMDYPCPPEAELARHIGPPLHEGFAEILACRDKVKIDHAIALYRERFGTVGLYENGLYDGIVPALETLKDLGAALYLCTAKPLVYAERIIEHFALRRFFKALYGSELDGTRTGKVELIAHVLERESLAPSDTYMVGDRAHDVIGAKANGVNPVAVLWGYGSREELAAAGAIVFCEKPYALGALFSHL